MTRITKVRSKGTKFHHHIIWSETGLFSEPVQPQPESHSSSHLRRPQLPLSLYTITFPRKCTKYRKCLEEALRIRTMRSSVRLFPCWYLTYGLPFLIIDLNSQDDRRESDERKLGTYSESMRQSSGRRPGRVRYLSLAISPLTRHSKSSQCHSCCAQKVGTP